MLKKDNILSCLRQIILSLFTMISSIAYAYDFEVDGLCYNIIASDQVEVTYKRKLDGGYYGPIKIPETVIYNDVSYSVTSVGDFAFSGCKNITSITIPNSVISIGIQAFNDCEYLSSLTIPNSVTTIGKYAFGNCSGLRGSLTLPNSLRTIGYQAFAGCSGFTGSLTIPNSVTTIGDGAFAFCRGFSGSLTIPNSVTYIGAGAFADCSGFSGSLTISNSLTSIESGTFSGCSSLTGSLIIPNSVISIGNNAFEGCSGLTGSLTIPNSVTTIGNGAFVGCSGLTGSLTIPISVTTIGNSAFNGCKGIADVYSYIINPFPIGNYVFDNISSNAILHIPKGTKGAYNQYENWICNFKYVLEEGESIPVTYTLSIKASGNGSASYGEESIRNTTSTFTVNEGTSVSVSFNPDSGYRIKSLKVNNSAVTASNIYSATINADTSIEVEFEAIPPTTYTLSIKATGNGSASYGGETIRNTTKSYTINEGTSITVSFSPDTGYRIKSLKVNNTAVTATSTYSTTINADTSIEVEFEAIPPITYTLSIKATGNGSATYGTTSVRNTTSTFTVNEGTNISVSFSPDTGYRIKSLKVNNTSVTTSTTYTATINADTSIEVEFEAIPPTTYTLSIKATGNGSATYGTTSVRNTTSTFTVNEGTSVSISFSPDTGYRIKSLKVNKTSVTASTTYTATINADTSIEVEFEAIPPTTYTLSIKATGNGSATYGTTSVRNTTSTFTVNEGTNISVSFSPDTGYRIKSLKVNNTVVTASTTYTATINADTSIEVEFEAIPPSTYTLSIKATGNGTASYGGTTIRGRSSSFTVNDGTSVTISFEPDTGYRIQSVKVNNSDVTSKLSNNKYTLSVTSDTSVEVVFEAIPKTTYTLSIRAKGNGIATYNGETIRATTKSYTIEEGTTVTMTFTPDEDNQIKSLRVNGAYVTVSDTYEAKITADTSIKIDFEEIPVDPEPPVTYSLTIKATGNGAAIYGGEIIRDNISTFTLNEGTTGTITFTPDEGHHIKSLMVDGSTIGIANSYSFTMDSDKTVEVVFEETIIETNIIVDGNNYEILSHHDHTLKLIAEDFDYTLIVPDKIEYQGEEWTVTGIDDTLLDGHEDLAAIIWDISSLFTARVTNPNLLLYVKDEQYAPATIKNVVVNGYANSITLSDAQSGNNFYCPETFTAQSISYTHNYLMKTGLYESRGWETIALPFDVQKVSHSSKGEIVPYARWTSGSRVKPFWLYELSSSGFVAAEAIKANTPYIISMPNNEAYPSEYHLTGRISFSSENVTVEKSNEIQVPTFSDRSFTPNFICRDANAGYYALNVSNDYEYYQGSENEGSRFILNLRQIHPFEAYMNTSANTRSIGIFDDMTTDIRGIEILANEKTIKVYDLSGKLLRIGTPLEDIKQGLPAGVYIVNHQKIMIK